MKVCAVFQLAFVKVRVLVTVASPVSLEVMSRTTSLVGFKKLIAASEGMEQSIDRLRLLLPLEAVPLEEERPEASIEVCDPAHAGRGVWLEVVRCIAQRCEYCSPPRRRGVGKARQTDHEPASSSGNARELA